MPASLIVSTAITNDAESEKYKALIKTVTEQSNSVARLRGDNIKVLEIDPELRLAN